MNGLKRINANSPWLAELTLKENLNFLSLEPKFFLFNH